MKHILHSDERVVEAANNGLIIHHSPLIINCTFVYKGDYVHYYIKDNTYFISNEEIQGLDKTSWEKLLKSDKNVYYFNTQLSKEARVMYRITEPSMLELKEESLEMLDRTDANIKGIDPNLVHLIERGRLIGLNSSYDNCIEWALKERKTKWRVHLLGLGDVGGTLATGLRLLGRDSIETLGIYDRDEKRLDRWERELNQIKFPFMDEEDFKVEPISYDDLFNCDMFVFCASRFIPEVGSKVKDVRMAQFESNAEIINEYAKLARQHQFKGIFAVVSDPVDLLCKCVYKTSNENEQGEWDGQGLPPDRIRGYGLGVMNARALYYADQQAETRQYLKEGRAFGPHGKDLIIADSINDYNHESSMYLTNRTIKANLEVRDAGYKPYIAPALSSGAISLIATIKGEWHYSATFMKEVYMGSKNRFKDEITELEKVELPEQLKERLQTTYDQLKAII